MTRWADIASDLERRIESKKLHRGSLLPTEKELQEEYGASRNTVRQAIALLVDKRIVEPRQGQGTYILQEIETFVTTLSRDPKNNPGEGGEEAATYPDVIRQEPDRRGPSTPTAETVTCPEEIAPLLGLSEKDFVSKRHQNRYIDGTIWSVQDSYYPWKWVDMGAKRLQYPVDIDEGAVAYLAESIGVQEAGLSDLIFARLPTDEEQALFNLKRNHPVMEAYRTAFTEDGTPVRVTVTIWPADRNQLSYDYGTLPELMKKPIKP